MLMEWVSDGKCKIKRYESGTVELWTYEITETKFTRKGEIHLGSWILRERLKANQKDDWAYALSWYLRSGI